MITDDHRAHPRYASRLGGRLLTLDGRHNLECTITDISEGGARISAADPQPLSGEASLFLVRTGDILASEIRWQRASEIGLRFVDSVSVAGVLAAEPVRRDLAAGRDAALDLPTHK